MVSTIELHAPGKINIHLRVLAKRPDGFHGLESIFQTISLCDRLTLKRTDADNECKIDCPGFNLPPVNTVSHAVDVFRDHTGIRNGLHFFLDKQIPSGAGLGGGSSDAASALTALNRLFDAGLSDTTLHALACRIGSDVPFFLGSSTALVQGRGELLSPIATRSDVYGVLIWPGIPCLTAEAYSLVDIWQEDHLVDTSLVVPVESLATVYAGPLAGWTQFSNSFTAPIEARYPLIRTAREALLYEGAFFAEMSGSGSSVFGFFRDKQEAELAFSRLSIRWDLCRKFLLLAHSPMR